MILLIDNYDSFVHNLSRYLRRLGQETLVVRNDAISVEEVRRLSVQAMVLSPGPKSPPEAGCSLGAGPSAVDGDPHSGHLPGPPDDCGRLWCPNPTGRSSRCMAARANCGITATGLFSGLPNPLCVARYHSLVVDPATLPRELVATAFTADGTLMALQHRQRPVVGWQFHPESILTPHGYELLAAFLQRVGLPINARRTQLGDEQARPTTCARRAPVGSTQLRLDLFQSERGSLCK